MITFYSQCTVATMILLSNMLSLKYFLLLLLFDLNIFSFWRHSSDDVPYTVCNVWWALLAYFIHSKWIFCYFIQNTNRKPNVPKYFDFIIFSAGMRLIIPKLYPICGALYMFNIQSDRINIHNRILIHADQWESRKIESRMRIWTMSVFSPE